MITTVGAMIRAAHRALGKYDKSQDIDSEDYVNGTEVLNGMLARWAANGVTILQNAVQNFTMVVGQGSYTIGSGGNVDITRPTVITSAYIQDTDDNFSKWVRVIDQISYEKISIKTTADDYPEYLYYQPSYPLAELNLYPIPAVAYKLYFSAQYVLGSFADADDAISLPPETEDGIKYNLSLQLAPEFNITPSELVVALAREGYKVLSKKPIAPAEFEPGICNSASHRRHNIETEG